MKHLKIEDFWVFWLRLWRGRGNGSLQRVKDYLRKFCGFFDVLKEDLLTLDKKN